MLENEENINDSVNFAGLLRSRKCLMFLSLIKGVCFAFKTDFHRKQGSFVKTRRLWSLYVERKMTILWHMIMSRTCGTGAYMFLTKCHGSL